MTSHDNYDGSVCPRWGTLIECAVPPGTILAGKGALYVPLSCATCGSSWEEVYTLTGYRDLQPDDTEDDDD
jgi:hypothetical protein